MYKFVKSYGMPIAMVIGALFYSFFSKFSAFAPVLIFGMLFFTYLRIDLRKMQPTKMHLWLLLIQLAGSVAVFFLLHPFNPILAEGAMICVLAPTATSAPVIAKMLKGSVESLTTYSLLCNMAVLIVAPIFFTLIGENGGMSFLDSFLNILKHTALLLLGPLVLAIVFKKVMPKFSEKLGSYSDISFYLWLIALVIVISRTVKFISIQGSETYLTEVLLAFATFIICVLQFFIGRKIGRIYNDTVAGGQGLGQKNTVLAIWMAQTFLNPLSSVGPGAYVIWQNIVNSYQVWKNRKVLE